MSSSPSETPATAPPGGSAKAWGSAFEFILTSLGFAVGLGNIWRFPNMVFSNGGGAFLIPYGLCLIFIAIPLLLVEAAIGQWSAKGPIGVWDMVPLFRGCGIAAVSLSMINTVYYNAPISWAAFYLWSSVGNPLPWTQCGYWSTGNCTSDMAVLAAAKARELGQQISSAPTTTTLATTRHAAYGHLPDLLAPHRQQIAKDSAHWYSDFDEAAAATSAAEEYFYLRALRITSSLENWGGMGWDLLGCNFLIWLIIFGVVCKGAESLGKAAYFTTLFPYFMLTVLLIYTSTLPGAGEGIKFYLKADSSKLLDIRVWRSAVSQVFFSTGCACGGVIQMASYNRFQHNIVRDTILVPLLDGFTSIYAGFGVFTVLGYMAHQRGVSVANVVESGPGLIFVSYPEALSQMPGSQVWAFMFFFMICVLGLSSQFPCIETICGTLGAYFPWTQKNWKTLAAFRFLICMGAFVCGIFFYFGNGYFTYFLIDERVIGYPMIIIALFEAVGVAWVYGSDKLMENIEEMTGPWRYKGMKYFWIICWKVIAPACLGLIFILDIALQEPLEVLGYIFPHWAMVIAGFILSIPLACIVLYALHVYCKNCEGYKFLRVATLPSRKWIPAAASQSNIDSRPSSGLEMASIHEQTDTPSVWTVETALKDQQQVAHSITSLASLSLSSDKSSSSEAASYSKESERVADEELEMVF